MKKIILISGSPRKGNTEYILTEVKKQFKKAGFWPELILLRKIKIKDCLGCLACQDGRTCPLKVKNDVLDKLNKKLTAADYLITASPTYFNMITGLLKRWIDRTGPLYIRKALKGKHGSIIAVGGRSGNRLVLRPTILSSFMIFTA